MSQLNADSSDDERGVEERRLDSSSEDEQEKTRTPLKKRAGVGSEEKTRSQLNAGSSDEEEPAGTRSAIVAADSSDDDGGTERKKKTLAANSSDEEPISNSKVGSKESFLAADSSDDGSPMKGVAKKRPLAADSSDEDASKDRLSSKRASQEDSDSSVGVPDDMDPNVKVKKNLAAASSDEDNGKKNAIDSDSDTEQKKEKKMKKKRVKTLVDSDESDVDIGHNKAAVSSSEEEEVVKQEEKGSSKKKRKMKRMATSDSDEENDDPGKKTKGLFANKDLYDAESSEEDELPEPGYSSKRRESSGSEDSGKEEGEEGAAPSRPRSPKQSRKAMEKARDEIRSESARLLRESAIGLPYHRPKQRSLAEFLNRKAGQPEIVSDIKATRFDPYAQQKLEQREEAIKKFYKEEGEGEEEEERFPESKETKVEVEPGCGNQDGCEAATGTPSLSSVFDEEEAAAELEDGETKTAPGLASASARDHEDTLKSEVKGDTGFTKEEDECTAGLGPSNDDEIPKKDSNMKVNSDSLKLVLEDTAAVETLNDTVEETKEESEGCEARKDQDDEGRREGEEESLKLVLEPDTPIDEEDEVVLSSQVVSRTTMTAKSKAQERLERLRKKFGDLPGLEKSMNITPRVADGPDDQLVFCEKTDAKLSDGAEKLFQKFVNHAFARKGKKEKGEDGQKVVENVTIVTKKKAADGTEILCEEVVQYLGDEKKKKKKEAPVPGAEFVSMKEKLKAQMLERRLEVRKKRVVEMKINENELCDDLPDEEEFDDEEDYNFNDEEEYLGEDEEEEDEEESEPEENDVDMRDRKRIKNAFEDDEAEDEDMVDGDYDDDDDSIAMSEFPKKKSMPFKKIQENPELLSETSCASDSFKAAELVRNDMATPTIVNRTPLTSAPNSNSSTLQLPRWTPYQDRADVWGAQREEELANREEGESPTSSQLARKKLGFENLFDQTDPDVQEIDDVVDMGLLSGRFATQKPAAEMGEEVMQQTQADFSSSSIPQSRPQSRNMDTQDTVILTGASQDVSSAINKILEDVGESSDEEDEDAGDVLGEVEVKEMGKVEGEDCSAQETIRPDLSSDVDDGGEEIKESDEGVKVSKKRKRRLISDSEGSEDEKENSRNSDDGEALDEEGDLGVMRRIEYDSDENPVAVAKPVKNRMLTKGGKLRKDFVEGEAELSGSELGSDDEDERGLDQFEEMEGDQDDIDEDKERDKLGRIAQRMALDEDQANLKLFQDRFLEDGDLHTDYKRERQFKWAGLDDRIELGPGQAEEGEGEEEESLEKWRLEKMEKERWLKEQKIDEGGEDHDESKFFALADRTLQRMTSKEEEAAEAPPKEKVFKSPLSKLGPLLPLQNGALRGSFLARNADALDRLEKFNKHKEEKVGVGAKGRNFVFAAISPPKEKETLEDEEQREKEKGRKTSHTKGPAPKKPKLNRNLDENSRRGTIFNLL